MTDPSEPANRWSAKDLLTVVFVGSYLLVQTVVPLMALTRSRPARFGWQMFSATPSGVAFTLIFDDGRRQVTDVRPFIGQTRGELVLDDDLPPHLCRLNPGVVAVEVAHTSRRDSRRYSCP
jgi:hypothetical protein